MDRQDKARLDNYLTTIPDTPDVLDTVISFDVGKTTGVVIADVYGTNNFEVLKALHLDYAERFKGLQNLLIEYQPTLVIIENFRLYKHKAQSLIHNEFLPVRMIGAIESALYYYDSLNLDNFVNGYMVTPTPVVFQMAIEIKGKPPVAVLPEHKPLLKGLKHATDAYKHLRVYTLKNYGGLK